ncbi:MAG TPA: hypothetical protein VF589_09620 [Allosphingosinicella sp.]|jgi:Ca2+-binding RTX toxin-like protein
MPVAHYPQREIVEVADFVREAVKGTASSEAYPDMVRLADGRHVLVWSEPAYNDQPSGTWLQFLDSDGVPQGEPAKIGAGDAPVSVTATSDGFILSYRDGSLRGFDGDGQAETGILDLADTKVDVATLADGRIVAAYVEDQVVKVQIFSEDLQPLGAPIAVDGADLSRVEVAALGDGGFAVAYEDEGGRVSSRKYDADGAPVSGVVHHGASDAPEFSSGRPSISASGAGGYAVVWTEASFHDGPHSISDIDEQVQLQLVGPDGTKVTGPILINENDTGGFVIPTIRELADGGFYVTWGRSYLPDDVDYSGTNFDYGLAGRGFDSSGNPVLGEVMLSERGSIVEPLGAIGQAANGDIFVAFDFSDRSRDGSIELARLRQYQGSELLLGSEGKDNLTGGEGRELLFGDGGDDTLAGGGDNDIVLGGDGADRLFGDDGNDRIDGGVGNDHLNGGVGDDEIFGGAGNDRLFGGPGLDRLDGGTGSDTYVVSNRNTVVHDTGGGEDIIVARVDFSLTSAIGVADLRLAGAAVTGEGNESANRLIGNGLANTLLGLAGGDSLAGEGGDDRLFGNDGDDLLKGGAGMDRLNGGAGNDRLEGGEGDDILYVTQAGDSDDLNTLVGGAGNDRYVIDSRVDRFEIVEEANGGIDRVVAYQNTVLAAEVEELELLGGATEGTGNALDNLIIGNAGDNILNGAGGADRLVGGAGDDEYWVVDGLDTIEDSSGYDRVLAFRSFVLSDGLEELELQNGGDFNGTGNGSANRIEGNSGDNVLAGSGGDDRLIGRRGDDELRGGSGHDLLDGGVGNDTLLGQSGIDTASYRAAAGAVTIDLAITIAQDSGGAGFDRIAGVENLVGSNFDDRLAGGEVRNSLDGGTGDDTLIGRGGNDLLLGGDGSDDIRGGDGADQLIGGSQFDELNGEGGADVIRGGFDIDRLSGGAGDDRLFGNAGDDRIAGGEGLDQLMGGAGDDLFAFDDGDTGAARATADRVLDWDEGDRIDLSAVDADRSAGGDQAFSFIGNDAFGGTAGELRSQTIAGDLYLQGDMDGDGNADLMVRVDDLAAITAADLIL